MPTGVHEQGSEAERTTPPHLVRSTAKGNFSAGLVQRRRACINDNNEMSLRFHFAIIGPRVKPAAMHLWRAPHRISVDLQKSIWQVRALSLMDFANPRHVIGNFRKKLNGGASMEQKISAVAIELLKEALCNVYWYKNNLRSFLNNCINDTSVINRTDWNGYKRQIVSDIVDKLCINQEKYLGVIRRLISEVIKMENFYHLEQLEDGKKKAERAKQAVANLKQVVEDQAQSIKEEEEIKRKRLENLQRIRSSQAVLNRLDEIKTNYFRLVTSKEYQKRGFELEKVLYDLFELFDLDPKASFRNTGEQIDGAFTLEGTDYLFEAKWQNHLINASDLDSFSGKVKRKLDNTLGLFLSVNGFSQDAVRIHSVGRSTVLLMDGTDLMAVLENQIDFVSLIVRKRRYAAQTGNIYLKINEVLHDL